MSREENIPLLCSQKGEMLMKIDREKIKKLAALEDEKLWAEIRAIAKSHGFNLPEKTPPKSDLDKVRAAMTAEKINLGGALKILNSYRKGNG